MGIKSAGKLFRKKLTRDGGGRLFSTKEDNANGPYDTYNALSCLGAPFTEFLLNTVKKSFQRPYKIANAYDLGKSWRTRLSFSMIID